MPFLGGGKTTEIIESAHWHFTKTAGYYLDDCFASCEICGRTYMGSCSPPSPAESTQTDCALRCGCTSIKEQLNNCSSTAISHKTFQILQKPEIIRTIDFNYR